MTEPPNTYDTRLAERIRVKRQYEHELAHPQEYAEMETQLREWLHDEDLEIEDWADKTILHWGHNPRLVFQAYTRGAAIKGVWQDEAAKRTRGAGRCAPKEPLNVPHRNRS
jgi:hypothetical protein